MEANKGMLSPSGQTVLSPSNRKKKMQQFIIGDKIVEFEYVSPPAPTAVVRAKGGLRLPEETLR